MPATMPAMPHINCPHFNEPDINPKILKTKNVVLLPHLGSATSKARNAMGFKVIENLKSYFNSGKGIDIVNSTK